jgi:hypothetical protein
LIEAEQPLPRWRLVFDNHGHVRHPAALIGRKGRQRVIDEPLERLMNSSCAGPKVADSNVSSICALSPYAWT